MLAAQKGPDSPNECRDFTSSALIDALLPLEVV
jgi:hypothetical protein